MSDVPTNPISDLDIQTSTVRITKLSGRTVTLDYEAGKTVREWIEAAGPDFALEEGMTINVNGNAAGLDDLLEPQTVITIANRVRNG